MLKQSDWPDAERSQPPTLPHAELLFAYRDALLTHFPHQIQQLILFGSQARGEAHAESDIDVMVIVDWEEEQLPNGLYAHPYFDPRWRTIINLAHDLSLEFGAWLSPKVMSGKRFAGWSLLGEEVKEDGIVIWVRLP